MPTLFGSGGSSNNTGGSTLFGGTSNITDNNPYSADNIQKQISNAELRVNDAGVNPDDANKRNWFEEFTNLPAGQNAFFDTLDILGRGGNAVKNVIDKSITSNREDIGTAAYRGFAGRENVSGADLMKKAGVNNKVGQFVGGLATDILVDPTTYIPGGVVAKGVGTVAKPVIGAAKGAYNLLEEASPAVKAFRETRLAPAAESTKDALGHIFNPDYKKTETLFGGESDFLKSLENSTEASRKFMQEDNALRLANTARAAGGVDTGADIGRIVEAPLRQFEDVKAYEFPDGLTRTDNKGDLFGAMDANRGQVKSLGQDIRSIGKEYDRSISQTATALQKVDDQIRKQYYKVEDRTLNQLANREVRQPVNPNFMARNKAFSSVGASPAFNLLLKQRDELKTNLDALRVEAKQAKQGSIDQINKLVDDNSSLKEASRNPVMIQKELPRPVRDVSQDPKLQKAASQIVSQNKEIVDFAKQNGIDIPELEGHMYHILSQEERAYKKTIGAKGSFLGSKQPSKSILNERQYKGSAEDINDKTLQSSGRRKFEDNAFFAQGIGQQRLLDYIHAVSFRRQVLSNPEFSQPFKKGMQIPKNSEVINSNNYKFLKESGDTLDGLNLADSVGGEYVVTKSAKQLLDRYQRLNTDEGTKAFLKVFDTIQSTWKRFALFSPGYHVRNLAGAMFNNSVGGMNSIELAKYTTQSLNEVLSAVKGSESKLFNEYRRQGLSSNGLSKVEFAKAGQEPEEAIRKTIESMSKSGAERVIDKVKPWNWFKTSQELGDFMDQTNRFALYKWSREAKGMTPEAAAAKVKEVQFDYSKLTPVEQSTIARVLPFYRWMKNNIPFQIRSFINDPRKYGYVNKARENAQQAAGLNDENMPDYMKEQFNIPVYGKNGKGSSLGLNLPLTDLMKLSNPLKTVTDSITPLIKTPIELATNYNLFKGKPIEKFKGQEKQFSIGGVNLGGIPMKAAYALEQATGQVGRGLSDYLQTAKDNDATFRTPSLGISSIVKPFDAAEAKRLEQLQRLKELQDLIMYVEQQQGQKPRTVKEIKKAR